MAKEGYVGHTATILQHKGKLVILSWSPTPGIMGKDTYDALLDEMLEYMTESQECWQMWWGRPLKEREKRKKRTKKEKK